MQSFRVWRSGIGQQRAASSFLGYFLSPLSPQHKSLRQTGRQLFLAQGTWAETQRRRSSNYISPMSKRQKQREMARPDPFFWYKEGEELDDAFPVNAEKAAAIGKWHEKLMSTVEKQYSDVVRNELHYVVSHAVTLTDKERTGKLFHYLSNHPFVITMKEEWKDEATDGSFRGFGFKVGGKRRAPDDLVYRDNPDLQRLLPRGFVMTQANAMGKPIELVLFSNRKFFGRTNNDDDDSDLISTTLRSGQFTHFIESNKANGESAQVALHPDGKTWIVGSKNRKVAAKCLADVAKYPTDGMYSYATEMAVRFFEYLAAMGASKAQELRELLLLTRWTLNFEYETPEHQHLVPLYEKQLVLIGCTGIHVKGTSMHPIFGCALGRYFGIPSVLRDTTTYPKEELDGLCKRIAYRWNDEGSVLILLDEQQRAIDFVKVKTFWYILLRAIREKIRSMCHNAALPRTCNRIVMRLNVLQRSMRIPEDVVGVFRTLGVRFAGWVASDMRRAELFTQGQYPMLWLSFLKAEGLPSDSSLLLQEVGDVKIESQGLSPILLLLQGIPGIGKSRMAIALVDLLEANGITAVQVAQDDFSQFGKKATGKCMQHITNLLEMRKHQVVILARNNSNFRQYDKYTKLDTQGLCRAVFLGFEEVRTRVEELAYLCMASVLSRKASTAEVHPTDSMDDVSLACLPLRFLSDYEAHRSAFAIPCMLKEPMDIPMREQFNAMVDKVLGGSLKDIGMSRSGLDAFGLGSVPRVKEVASKRRTPEAIAQDALAVVQQVVNADMPPIGSFFAVMLGSDAQKSICDSVQRVLQLPDGFMRSWNLFGDHVTLQHSVRFFEKQEAWRRLVAYTGAPVTITPVQLVYSEKIATLKVRLTLEENQESIDELVITGLPHVTIACAPGVSAFYSIDAFAGATEDVIFPVDGIPAVAGVVELVNA